MNKFPWMVFTVPPSGFCWKMYKTCMGMQSLLAKMDGSEPYQRSGGGTRSTFLGSNSFITKKGGINRKEMAGTIPISQLITGKMQANEMK